MKHPGTLYLVPVPIGNLGDITQRALDTLSAVEVITAEDTRTTGFLLSQYDIKAKRLLSLHKYNEKSRLNEVMQTLLAGSDVAIVSDAGSPGISDPAMMAVKAAIDANITVIPLPGASALIPAITASGMLEGPFQFLGFIPAKGKERSRLLEEIRAYPHPSVIYEAPHRLRKTLQDILQHCGDRRICVSREISKMHEEHIRGTLRDILDDYSITEKGEIVITVSGNEAVEATEMKAMRKTAQIMLSQGISPTQVTAVLRKLTGESRDSVYQLVLDITKSMEN